MGLFGKKNENIDFDDGHNNNLFTDDDDDMVFFGSDRVKLGENSKTAAPHAMTKDEILHIQSPETIEMESSAAPSVYDILKEQELKRKEAAAIEDDYVPSWATKSQTVEVKVEENVKIPKAKHEDAEKMMPEIKPSVEKTSENDDFLARCRQAADLDTFADETKRERIVYTPEHIDSAVLEKFSVSEEKPQTAVHTEADIDAIIRRLKGEIEENKTAEEPNKAETADVEVEKVPTEEPAEIEEVLEEVEPLVRVNETVEAEILTDDTTKELKVEVEVIPTDREERIMNTVSGEVPDSDVKIFGKVIGGTVVQKTAEGVIVAEEFVKPKPDVLETEATVVFGSDFESILSQKADESFAAANRVREEYDDEYDLEDETMPYYESEDESLADIDDYKSLDDSAKLRVQYENSKTHQTTVTVLSCVLTAAGLFASLPFMQNLIGNKPAGVITLLMLTCLSIINYSVFADIGNLFKNRPSFDSCVSVALVLGLLQCAVDTLVFGGVYTAAAVSVMLLASTGATIKLLEIKRIKSGLEKIATSEIKKAVILADTEVGDIISSGVDLDEVTAVLGKDTVNVRNYMKNSLYRSPFELKITILLIVGLIAAVLTGLLAGLLSGVAEGFAMATLIFCAVLPLCSAFSAELPLYRAVKRITSYGAMLAGYKGAYELNLSNVVSVNSSDLFPEQCIKLYNMKPLSENEVGRSIVDAAAVAIAAKSPLAGIFREIIGNTESQLPKVGGVKYEDKMGVSGWIGENTVLIGNRNLMQAHNIAVPPAAVDQKILKAGYFPVYIACNGKPCLLFVVKYEVDPHIREELNRLCNTGMTVVVNPEDPNTTDVMICDYFGLPNDAVRLMNHNARVAFSTESAFTESSSASAAYSKSVCGLFSAISGGINIWKKIRVLTAMFITAAVVSTVILIMMALFGKLLAASFVILGIQLVFIIASILLSSPKR
jgi:hypothetical protein